MTWPSSRRCCSDASWLCPGVASGRQAIFALPIASRTGRLRMLWRDFVLWRRSIDYLEAIPEAPQPSPGGRGRGADILQYPTAYHRKSEAPQLKPVPKAASRHRSPRLMRPSWRASCRRMGTEAAEVLPYLWIFTGTFEAGMLRLSATASRMRTFAWWNRK